MNDTIQPDLFGQYDAMQERSEYMAQPATCPRCGTREPNRPMLASNHGADAENDTICGFGPTHPIYGPHCVAQYLVTNHIIYALRHDNAELLAERSARARELNLDVDALISFEMERTA